jgi:integrase
MPASGHRVLLAGRTAAERRRRRAGLRLRDFSITTKTRQRYEYAVGKVLPFLEKHQKLGAIDEILCEYVEAQWARGESVNFIADTLSGLHFFWPELRGLLREAWRLFKQWRRIEAPTRAPPITPLLVRAIVCRAVQRGDLAFATLVAVGFHALLRTGELLSLRYCDLEFNQTQGILSLQYSKSGLRTGTQEAVALRDVTTLQLLDTLFSCVPHFPGQKLWSGSAQTFRNLFAAHLRFFRVAHFQYKPYSLRRGGATFLLQEGVPLEAILLRGRWKSLSVGRLYLQDGMAQLPALRIPMSDLQRIHLFADESSPTTFRP